MFQLPLQGAGGWGGKFVTLTSLFTLIFAPYEEYQEFLHYCAY